MGSLAVSVARRFGFYCLVLIESAYLTEVQVDRMYWFLAYIMLVQSPSVAVKVVTALLTPFPVPSFPSL